MDKKKIEYPKYLYHESKEPVAVQSIQEQKALGAGWKESPADFKKPSKPEKAEKPEKVVKPKPAKKPAVEVEAKE